MTRLSRRTATTTKVVLFFSTVIMFSCYRCGEIKMKTILLLPDCLYLCNISVRLQNERCSGGTKDACQGGMECLAGRCTCPHGARPTADRQHCLQHTEKLLGHPCSPTFDTCLHKSGNYVLLMLFYLFIYLLCK